MSITALKLLGLSGGLISTQELAIGVAAAIVEGRTGIARATWRQPGKAEDKGDTWRVEIGPGDDASPLPDVYVIEIKKADCQILAYEPIKGLFDRFNQLG